MSPKTQSQNTADVHDLSVWAYTIVGETYNRGCAQLNHEFYALGRFEQQQNLLKAVMTFVLADTSTPLELRKQVVQRVLGEIESAGVLMEKYFRAQSETRAMYMQNKGHNEDHITALGRYSSDDFLKLFTTELQMVVKTIESTLPIPDVADVKVTTVRPTKI